MTQTRAEPSVWRDESKLKLSVIVCTEHEACSVVQRVSACVRACDM